MDTNGLTPKDMDVFYEATADEPVWYVFRNERHFGPFSIQWIQELLSLGVIHQDHHVWQPKLEEWKPIHSFENLRAYGHGVTLQKLSDNDFESILQAEDYKAEKRFEVDALDFAEPETAPKAPTSDVVIKRPLTQVLEQALLKARQRLIEFREDHPRKALGAGVASVALMAWGIFIVATGIHLSGAEKNLIDRLSTMDQAVVGEILSVKASDSGLQAGVFSTRDRGEIVLVTNLADQSPVELLIQGVQGTLVGYQRWNKTLNLKADQYVTAIPAEILPAGKVPAGEYKVTVKAAGIASFHWRHTLENADAYREQLNQYNSAMNAQRVLEQDEIAQVHRKLQEHFDFTLGEFQKLRRLRGKKKARVWKKHISNWQQDQARFDQVFASLSSEDFVNQLVYAKSYTTLSGISRDIASLQSLQETLIKSRKTASVAKSAKLAESIQGQLDGIRQKISQWNKE